jgi:hypothetical protein
MGIAAFGVQNVGAASSADAATALAPAVVSLSPSQFGDLGAGQPLKLTLTIADQSGSGIGASTATVSVDQSPITTGDGLADWFSGDTKASIANANVSVAAVAAVLPSSSNTTTVTVPAASLHFGSAGIYAIAVSVQTNGETIGSARTAVTWKVSRSRSVPVALAAPLTVPASSSTFISAKTLAADTSPTGVLTRELNELDGTHIAIGIDPRILASIRILGRSAPQSAKDWLNQLEAVSNDTFPLAWADADLTVALQAGATTVLSVPPLDYAITPSQFAPSPNPTDTPVPTSTPDPSDPPLPTSQSLVQFGYTLPDLSWPAEDTVTAADATKLENSGVAGAILSSDNVKRPDSLIPGGASAKVGALSVAISDATISGYLRDAVQSTTRAAWASAMAELTTSLALVGVQSGGHAQILLATLDRNWEISDTHFADTLTGLYTRSWVAPSELSAATDANPTTVKIVDKPQPASRVALVRSMLAAEQQQVAFSVVTEPNRENLTSSQRLILLSLLSDEWIQNPSGWVTAANAYLLDSHKIVTSVQAVKSSSALLLGDRVSLPITISNNLDQAVTVYVAVRPKTTLISVDKAHRLEKVTINANSQRRTEIPIQSLSNGKVEVQVMLYSQSGQQVGSTSVMNLDVQAGWETVGTLIFAALVVGIFAFGLVRNIRKRRKIAATEEEPAGEAA